MPQEGTWFPVWGVSRAARRVLQVVSPLLPEPHSAAMEQKPWHAARNEHTKRRRQPQEKDEGERDTKVYCWSTE